MINLAKLLFYISTRQDCKWSKRWFQLDRNEYHLVFLNLVWNRRERENSWNKVKSKFPSSALLHLIYQWKSFVLLDWIFPWERLIESLCPDFYRHFAVRRMVKKSSVPSLCTVTMWHSHVNVKREDIVVMTVRSDNVTYSVEWHCHSEEW